MIVCHCQNITDHDIRTAIGWMRSADPLTIITPRKVYRALNKSADCGGCMPLFLDTMRKSSSFEVPILRPLVPVDEPASMVKEPISCKATAKSSNT